MPVAIEPVPVRSLVCGSRKAVPLIFPLEGNLEGGLFSLINNLGKGVGCSESAIYKSLDVVLSPVA